MRRVAKVELVARSWHWDHEATPDEIDDSALLTEDAIIDGISIRALWIAEGSIGPFPIVTLEGLGRDFISLRIERPPRALWDEWSEPERHLMGSRADLLLLQVGELVALNTTRQEASVAA